MNSIVAPSCTSMTAQWAVGIGCRRGTSARDIEHAVRVTLGTLAFGDIACVASIDRKRDEAGLHAFCSLHGLPLRFYGADDIAQVSFGAHSAAAREHMNVDGVCEPCALLASGHGRLVVGKTIVGDVTVAIAQTSLNHQA
jgi:cobalt-precorrin 5A hydrolase